jgi:hypothetical protein
MDLLQSVTPASMALHEPPLVKYLHLSDRSIAYRHLEGKSPTLIYVGGFLSTMEIHKATIIEQYAKVHGRASIRYDQENGLLYYQNMRDNFRFVSRRLISFKLDITPEQNLIFFERDNSKQETVFPEEIEHSIFHLHTL